MTTFTPVTIKDPFATIAADGADFTFVAASAGADTFVCNGRDIILVQNTGAGARTVTITSLADEKNRTGDITTYSLAAGEFAVFGCGLTNSPGWKNTSTGAITITGSHAEVKVAILRLPTSYPG